MVRMYYPDPISTVKPSSAPRKQKPMDNDPLGADSSSSPSSMDLVLTFLKTIYICSCAEAVALVHSLGVDFNEFYRLATDAAGGSKMLQRYAPLMKKFLEGEQKQEDPGQDGTVNDLIKGLEAVVKEARRVECPLPLGSEALSLLLFAKRMGYGCHGPTGVVGLWSGAK